MFVDPLNGRHAENARPEIGETAGGRPDLVIGLVNIMPPAAMRTIENLFRLLLDACIAPGRLRLRLFSLNNGANGRSDAPAGYARLEELWESPDSEYPLDALIVTGTESRARRMQDEPCWPDLRKICDWAGEHTFSTLWSCFSAHAAVLHLDGIQRQAFPEKLSGIFECEKASGHPLLKNMPARWRAPHSRYNDLRAAELEAKHYEILSRAPAAGADSFIKRHKNSQFLFLQGHLEYGSDMLFSEYCRDLKRFSLGQRAVCPKPPQNYFDPASLRAFQGAAPDMLASADFIRRVTDGLHNDWQAPARLLYTAWLGLIAEQKAAAGGESGAAFSGAFNSLRASETRAHIARS